MNLTSRSPFRAPALSLLLLLLLTAGAVGQTRSRIVGTVRDAKTREPLVGANVTVIGAAIGAPTDPDGRYVIVNVPIGTVRVQASLIGYTRQIVENVVVSADQVTTVDFDLVPGDISVEAVVVTAERDALHKEVTNTQLVVTSEQLIEAAGVREINAFLAKQPGISEENGFISIRGGAADQTGTMVNGLAYNNAAVGNAETSVPLSAIDQVSVLSGGFNAEYGNFRSGVINVTTKTGSKDGYHGTVTYSRNTSHLKRFGPSFYDAKNPVLAPYLDADVAFVGTAAGWAGDPYRQGQSETFRGWNAVAADYNIGKTPDQQATPLDFYLLSAWMFMTVPDYDGLAKLGYTVSDEQKKLFEQHAMKEEGMDENFDGGFGGPIPLIGKFLGDATFYIANNTTRNSYVMPVVRPSEFTSTTFGTIRADLMTGMTLTLNGLYKWQAGVSQVRPAFGDFPDASRDGGFMPIDNSKAFARNHDYWFDPPFFSELNQHTLLTGATLNHVVNPSTYWELSLSYLNIADENPRHGDWRDTSVVTWFGPFPVDEMPYGKWQFASSHYVGGYKYPNYDVPAFSGLPYRFRGKEGDLYDNINVDQYRAKLDVASQIDENNYLKGGVEYNQIHLHHNFWEKWNPNAYNAYEFNYDRTPSQTGVYIQDQMSYSGILANLGLRFDYFYGGGGKWPSGDPFATAALTPVPYGTDSSLFAYLASGRSYIWDQWVSYDSTHPGFLQPVKNHATLSPRIGLSFPVTERSKFYFNYGHFRSSPPYYSMFLLRYRYTKNGLYDMPNPNLEPPKTIQYELGVVYNFYESYTARVSGYYKDVTGQNGDITYVNAQGSIDYNSWANNNYQDVEGLEVTLSKQDDSWLTGTVNFDYRLSKSGLTGVSTITDVPVTSDDANKYQGQETRFLPRPSLNATLAFRSPATWGLGWIGDAILGDWRLTLFGQWRAGAYDTWNPLGQLHVSNDIQWPDYTMIDLKLNKTIPVAGVRVTFYVDVKNVFNLKTNVMSSGYCFRSNADQEAYLASLHLPMFNSPDFDAKRAANAGLYIAGNDKIGDLRSASKPYINDPDYPFWIYSNPRDIWFGLRVDF